MKKESAWTEVNYLKRKKKLKEKNCFSVKKSVWKSRTEKTERNATEKKLDFIWRRVNLDWKMYLKSTDLVKIKTIVETSEFNLKKTLKLYN